MTSGTFKTKIHIKYHPLLFGELNHPIEKSNTVRLADTKENEAFSKSLLEFIFNIDKDDLESSRKWNTQFRRFLNSEITLKELLCIFNKPEKEIKILANVVSIYRPKSYEFEIYIKKINEIWPLIKTYPYFLNYSSFGMDFYYTKVCININYFDSLIFLIKETKNEDEKLFVRNIAESKLTFFGSENFRLVSAYEMKEYLYYSQFRDYEMPNNYSVNSNIYDISEFSYIQESPDIFKIIDEEIVKNPKIYSVFLMEWLFKLVHIPFKEK